MFPTIGFLGSLVSTGVGGDTEEGLILTRKQHPHLLPKPQPLHPPPPHHHLGPSTRGHVTVPTGGDVHTHVLMDHWASQPNAKAALGCLLLPSFALGRSKPSLGLDCFPALPKAHLE